MSQNVKRYDKSSNGKITENLKGHFVQYADYKKLEKKTKQQAQSKPTFVTNAD